MKSPFAGRLAFGNCRNDDRSRSKSLSTSPHFKKASSLPAFPPGLSLAINPSNVRTARRNVARFSFVPSNNLSATALRRLP